MPYCENGGIKIHYEIEGDGPDLMMIHGFAANLEANWRVPGIAGALRDENRLVMMDCRGHGESDKPTDPAMYGTKMSDDILRLMDHLGIEKANFLGYSMGSRLLLGLLLSHPARVRSAILGGFGLPDPQHPAAAARRRTVPAALLAESLEEVTDPVGRAFRMFAESTGADLKALAAVQGGWDQAAVEPEALEARVKAISVPLMTIVGNDDALISSGPRLAMMVPDGCHFQIEGKDHLSVVADPKLAMVVKAFLSYVNHLK